MSSSKRNQNFLIVSLKGSHTHRSIIAEIARRAEEIFEAGYSIEADEEALVSAYEGKSLRNGPQRLPTVIINEEASIRKYCSGIVQKLMSQRNSKVEYEYAMAKRVADEAKKEEERKREEARKQSEAAKKLEDEQMFAQRKHQIELERLEARLSRGRERLASHMNDASSLGSRSPGETPLIKARPGKNIFITE